MHGINTKSAPGASSAGRLDEVDHGGDASCGVEAGKDA